MPATVLWSLGDTAAALARMVAVVVAVAVSRVVRVRVGVDRQRRRCLGLPPVVTPMLAPMPRGDTRVRRCQKWTHPQIGCRARLRHFAGYQTLMLTLTSLTLLTSLTSLTSAALVWGRLLRWV